MSKKAQYIMGNTIWVVLAVCTIYVGFSTKSPVTVLPYRMVFWVDVERYNVVFPIVRITSFISILVFSVICNRIIYDGGQIEDWKPYIGMQILFIAFMLFVF